MYILYTRKHKLYKQTSNKYNNNLKMSLRTNIIRNKRYKI